MPPPLVNGRLASSWDDPPVPTSLTERDRPLEVLRIARNDIETTSILEIKGKGLAFDHGGRQIEVEEAAPGLFKSLQCRGQWFDSPPLHHPLFSKPTAPVWCRKSGAFPAAQAAAPVISAAGRRANIRIPPGSRRPSPRADFLTPVFADVVTGFASVYRPNPSSLR